MLSPGGWSSGYEAVASAYADLRSDTGIAVVRDWAANLPRGARVLDVGAGTGWPVTATLAALGCRLTAIEPSASLAARFRTTCPDVPLFRQPFERSRAFDRRYDAVVAIGVVFLLTERQQRDLFALVGRALPRGGRFLVTAPRRHCRWRDALTGRPSLSLGLDAYAALAARHGLRVARVSADEGGNDYLMTRKGT